MESEERLNLLADIAEMYYSRGMTQSMIARQFGFSRSAISRMLSEAKEREIVEIRINYPIQRSTVMERNLKDEFSLEEVFVVRRGTSDYPHMLRQLGRVGARYLDNHIPEKGKLGTSWGTGIYEICNSLRTRIMPELTVVQMIGAIGRGNPHIDGNELVRSIANTLGAKYHILHASLIVDSPETRQALQKERHIQENIALSLEAEIAVVGIGTLDPNLSSLVRAGYLTSEELQQIADSGAVGDVCANHYDINGRILDIDVNRRVVGVNIRNLADKGCQIIGVAGGKRKALGILGALRGGLVKVLITDSEAAEEVLLLHQGTA